MEAVDWAARADLPNARRNTSDDLERSMVVVFVCGGRTSRACEKSEGYEVMELNLSTFFLSRLVQGCITSVGVSLHSNNVLKMTPTRRILVIFTTVGGT